MAWMIGIDEAGYGPNLGPLVVAATVWRVDEAPCTEHEASSLRLASTATAIETKVDLYERLETLVSSAATNNRLAIADSKSLYRPRGGLRLLERGVLTALASSTGEPPRTWSELFRDCPPVPWYANYDRTLPVDADADEITELTAGFERACESVGVSLEGVHIRLVFPQEFNQLIEQHGTKGAALSHVTIGLLRRVLDPLPSIPCPLPTPQFTVSCDKHGGRNRYAGLLQHHFPEHWIETNEESRGVSSYAWGPPERRTSLSFRARGEAELPTALASMTAKYHRELAMQAFNAFWCAQVDGLAPTAGYPQDAKRFKTDIAERQNLLGIEDVDLWRNR